MSETGLWMEFLIRALATGLVVVLVAQAAAKLGPAVGGIIAGLPIVLAPGFFFLVRDASPAFVSEMAAGTLYSMIATQVFLLAYVFASGRWGAAASTLTATLAWCGVAFALAHLPHDLLVGMGMFLSVTLAARLIALQVVSPPAAIVSASRWRQLLLRGVAAGLLVGIVTLLSPGLGPAIAGALLGFPVGFCVILLSINLDHGSAIAGRTAYGGLIGVVSLATFSAALSTAVLHLPPWWGYGAALMASVLVTAVLTVLMRHLGRPNSSLTPKG